MNVSDKPDATVHTKIFQMDLESNGPVTMMHGTSRADMWTSIWIHMYIYIYIYIYILYVYT